MRRLKPGLSMDQHRALAADLREMEGRLERIVADIERAYPIGSPVQARTKGLLRKVSRLRWALSYEITHDHPREPGVHDLYYGGEEDET